MVIEYRLWDLLPDSRAEIHREITGLRTHFRGNHYASGRIVALPDIDDWKVAST